MKKIWEKIKNYFIKGCKNTAEVKDVVISEEENQCHDAVFVKPLEEDFVENKPPFMSKETYEAFKDAGVVIKDVTEEVTPKKPKRKYKKRVKPENK